MSKKKYRILFFGILLLFGVIYTYYLTPIVDDELFNYGFSKSILDGLVPYRDFNMIVPCFPHFLLSILLLLFGKKLIVYHIVINLIIVTYTYICYKKIGKGAFIIYLLSYYYPYTLYNVFSLLLLFILFYIIENNNDNKYIGFIIGLMFLCKQTLGILILPMLWYSKNKIKSFISFLIPIFIFLIIIIYNNSFFEFINYCFLGMLDFSSDNGSGFNILFII